MADLDAVTFARAVQHSCHAVEIVASYDVQLLDDVVVKIRVALVAAAFIDVFYNADSGKCAFALVQDGRRIFGADNAYIGWHLHPFENPEQHLPCDEISFEEFLNAVEAAFTQNRFG